MLYAGCCVSCFVCVVLMFTWIVHVVWCAGCVCVFVGCSCWLLCLLLIGVVNVVVLYVV